MRNIPVAWRTRAEPLAAVAAAALDGCARELAASLRLRDDAALGRLRGVARSAPPESPAEEVIVVLGEPNDLPWVDGITYLGRDPRSPSLLVPVLEEPHVSGAAVLELVERELVRRCSDVPLAVLPSAAMIVPCGRALTITRSRLKALGRTA
jgi:hypothetical protein